MKILFAFILLVGITKAQDVYRITESHNLMRDTVFEIDTGEIEYWCHDTMLTAIDTIWTFWWSGISTSKLVLLFFDRIIERRQTDIKKALAIKAHNDSLKFSSPREIKVVSP